MSIQKTTVSRQPILSIGQSAHNLIFEVLQPSKTINNKQPPSKLEIRALIKKMAPIFRTRQFHPRDNKLKLSCVTLISLNLLYYQR